MKRMHTDREIRAMAGDTAKQQLESGNLPKVDAKTFGVVVSNDELIETLNEKATIEINHTRKIGNLLFIDMIVRFTDDISANTPIIRLKERYIPLVNQLFIACGASNPATRVEISAVDGNISLNASQSDTYTLDITSFFTIATE